MPFRYENSFIHDAVEYRAQEKYKTLVVYEREKKFHAEISCHKNAIKK